MPGKVTVAEFEGKCLELIDEVAKRRTPLIVMKDGKPWVKVLPTGDGPIDIFGCMAGTIEIVGDIISPIEEDEWTGDADNV